MYTRRDFLEATGTVLGAAAFGGAVAPPEQSPTPTAPSGAPGVRALDYLLTRPEEDPEAHGAVL